MGANTGKIRLLRLYQYLRDNTDVDHAATTYDLLDMLAAEGIQADRKTLKSDMEVLTSEATGHAVAEVRSNPNRYYWDGSVFELPELKLLADAVTSSRFITAKKSAQLISKLGSLTSSQQSIYLQRHVYSSASVKPANENIYYIVDTVNEAITLNRRIRFRYLEYNAKKEKVFRGDGELYTLSPYVLYWNDDFYYVVGWSDKHGNVSAFRADRLDSPEILRRPSVPPPEDWNIEEYSKQVFEMYGGEREQVTIECQNAMMKYVIDHFGEDVRTKVLDEEHFLAFVDVALSPTFYSWLFTFAGKMRIIAPQTAREAYAEMARMVLEG